MKMKQPKYNKYQTPLKNYIDVDEVGGNEYLMRFKKKEDEDEQDKTSNKDTEKN